MEPLEKTYFRLFAQVAGKDDCWEWRGAKNWKGYGVTQVHNQFKMAHRAMYEVLVGPIPEGLQIDHLCRNRGCVNPNHLEPVTVKENLSRGLHYCSEKTHCKRGHLFDEKNTRWVKTPSGNRGRSCRACEALRRKWKRAKERGSSSVEEATP